MANRGLGSLTLDLIAKIGGFTGPLDKAGRDLDRRLTAMGKSAAQFGKIIGTGVAAAVTTLTVLTKQAIDTADAVRDMSIRLGVDTETLSAYGYAASQTGTDIETLGRGLKILTKNAADAMNPISEQAKVFAALGINVTDAAGKLRDLSELVPEIADKFASMADGTTKAALAQALFGKAGLELTELLNQGSIGLEEFTARARELGIVIDQETATAADEFNDTLGDLKALVSGLGLQIAKGVLPQLKDLASEFSNTATEGDKVGEMAHDIIGFLNGVAAVVHGVTSAFEILGTAMASLAASGTAVGKVLSGRFSEGIAIYKEAKAGFKAEIDEAFGAGAAPVEKKVKIKFITADSGSIDASALRKDADLELSVGKALSNPTAPKAGGGAKKSPGKSDAQREAEQLEESYKRMVASLKEQIAFTADLTEVEKTRYELANGELAKLDEGKKNEILALTATLEAERERQQLMEDGKALTESLMTPTEQLNELRVEAAELLEAGAIAQDAYNRAIEAYKDPGQQLLQDLQFELDLLRMTNAERATAIQLRGMDAEQVAKYGEAIQQANQDIIDMHEQLAFMDDLKAGLSDMFVDFISGAKSAKEAFGDFADMLFARALQFVADKAIQAMFDAFSGSGQSSGGETSGGGWADIFSSILGAFGGGKASGGWARPNTLFEVNERGLEMASVGGRDYLLTGPGGAQITPAGKWGGGDMSQVNNFNFVGRVDRRTQDQVEATLAMRSQRAMQRNG